MEKREQARKLYKDSGGKMLLRDIAAQLGIAEGTLRSWKKRDNWDGKNATLQISATQRQRRAATNRKAAASIEANEELTDAEKDFCTAFVHAPSAAQAAMLTGHYSNYNSAKVNAWRMMQKPVVVEEITRLKAIKRTMMLADGDDVIEMHMRVAFADMSAFVEFGRETVPVMTAFGPLVIKDPETGENREITKEVNTVKFKDHASVDGTLISQVKMGKDGASVKLKDSQKSLDFLERYFLLNPMDQHKKDFDEKKLALEQQRNMSGMIKEDEVHGTSPRDEINRRIAGIAARIGKGENT